MCFWNHGILKRWLSKTNQVSGGQSFLLKYFAKKTQLYYPRFISIISENFVWRLIFVRCLWKHTFNICISKGDWYFLFQWSKYMVTLMVWLYSFYSSYMACPLLHYHLFSHHFLIKQKMRASLATWLSSY